MRLLIAILASVLVCSSFGQAPPVVRRSQQFTAIDARPSSARSPGPLKNGAGEALTRLDAEVLLLCAERIRDSLVRELGLASDRPGKILLVLRIAERPDELVGVAAGLTPDGWEYRMDIPDQIEPQRLVRGIVHTVLLEMANRRQGPKCAELPLWLVEGLTGHLISVAGPDLVVGSVPVGGMLRIVRERRGLDYLREARAALQTSGPPSFSELAYPNAERLVGNKLKVFQAAAQLFVYELLQSQHGPENLVSMLRELPKCWNWEVAFLRGFASEFRRMLDVEKKWSVDALAFTAQDASKVWSRMVSLDRLDDVMTVPAQVRFAADRLPHRQTVTLREVLSSWDSRSQLTVVQQKLAQLQVLRFSSSPELIPLIDSYYRALVGYLQKRNQAARTPETRMQSIPPPSLLAGETIKELEELDKRRQAFRPENVLSVNSPITR
jgi:hypothetical protein